MKIFQHRRRFIALAALLPLTGWIRTVSGATNQSGNNAPRKLVLSDFTRDEPFVIEGGGWRGFSDRVMGGISDASLDRDRVAGKNCARLTGTVTRESNGGFIQMALYFGPRDAELNGAEYRGIELLVYGNNEDYNVHVRTADCGWYDESYRYTFFAKEEWQRVRVPWTDFEPNGVSVPLDAARVNRIAVLGWMREFQADIALAEISLFA